MNHFFEIYECFFGNLELFFEKINYSVRCLLFLVVVLFCLARCFRLVGRLCLLVRFVGFLLLGGLEKSRLGGGFGFRFEFVCLGGFCLFLFCRFFGFLRFLGQRLGLGFLVRRGRSVLFVLGFLGLGSFVRCMLLFLFLVFVWELLGNGFVGRFLFFLGF